jgi:hypothetical protein
MALPKIPRNNREITYQVGRKKRVIHFKTNQVPVVIVPKEGIEQYIWQKAPLLPASLDMYLLYAMPVVSMIAVGVLVYLINQF